MSEKEQQQPKKGEVVEGFGRCKKRGRD